MSGFKLDRHFGIAYECHGLRYGPTAPAPLVVFLPLYALAWLWAWGTRRWRLILSLALLALVGCQATPTPPVSPIGEAFLIQDTRVYIISSEALIGHEFGLQYVEDCELPAHYGESLEHVVLVACPDEIDLTQLEQTELWLRTHPDQWFFVIPERFYQYWLPYLEGR